MAKAGLPRPGPTALGQGTVAPAGPLLRVAPLPPGLDAWLPQRQRALRRALLRSGMLGGFGAPPLSLSARVMEFRGATPAAGAA